MTKKNRKSVAAKPLEKKAEGKQTLFFEQWAFRIAEGMGSVASLAVHTILFAGIFALRWIGFEIDQILLILTTIVSLEAIYMAIFIQMTVNKQARELSEVQHDIDEIQEDVEDISEEIEDIAEDVDDIAEDIDEIQEDIDEIQEDVDDIAEDVEELTEDEHGIDGESSKKSTVTMLKNVGKSNASKQSAPDRAKQMETIEKTLRKLLKDVEGMK